MRVLVTGGCGFVGSHLCIELARQGHDVVPLDNMTTGFPGNLPPELQAKIVTHDVQMPYPAFIGDFDRVYNLACPASPVHYQVDPIRTMLTCVLGALNLMEFVSSSPGTRVLQASTSEVYGDPLVHPQPEGYRGNVNPNGPRACYDEGKRAAESIFCDYARLEGAEVRIARIFNTYGPNMHPEDGRVVSNLIMQALKNEPLTVYGDGTQTRSFCYVSDMVDGLIALMESDCEGPVNLGNPGEFTVCRLADMVIHKTGSASEIVHMPLPEDDPRVRQPDISRAISELRWEPRVLLDEGLDHTIEYFRQVIKLEAGDAASA
jgi:UDP-glucuronate decarboxylase